jgi:hypothetical protein
MSEQEKWEYWIHSYESLSLGEARNLAYDEALGTGLVEDRLNEDGAKGWELVWVLHQPGDGKPNATPYFVFKRPIQG